MITSCLDYQSDPEQQTAALCWLREQHRQGTLVGALGTGIVFMALSGLLENRTVTALTGTISRVTTVTATPNGCYAGTRNGYYGYLYL